MYKRFLRFAHNVLKSANKCTSLCARLMINGSKSAACNNINLICDKLKCGKNDIENIPNKCYNMINAAVSDICDEPELLKCGNIKDLLYIRDNSSSNLTNEIKTLLDFFCTCIVYQEYE